MNLEVGMYVRTTYGRIYKIEKIETTKVYYSCNPPELQWQDREFVYSKSGVEYEDAILKASHNIIDLIEVGDYVNGYKVYYCYCADEDMTGLFIDTEEKKRVWLDYSSQLKSIVTKEAFSSVEYRMETN